MYQAKKSGRNTLKFFEPVMQKSINSRAALEFELREAIEAHHFRLYYQIQVDSLNRSDRAEALVRWIHRDRGLIMPDHSYTSRRNRADNSYWKMGSGYSM